MIKTFIGKISRFMAFAVWIMALLVLFLRFASGKPLPVPEYALINLNQSMFLLSVGLAILFLVVVILYFVFYLRSTGKLSFEISINETSTSKNEKLAEYKAQLYTLGFQDFAVYDALSLKNKEALCKAWSYVDETRTIFAEIAEFPKEKYVLVFISDYPDKFRLQTVFNKFSEFSTPLIFSRSFMKSLSAAFDYHLRQQAHFSKTHGQAKLFHELNDIFKSIEERQANERSTNMYYLRLFLKFAITSLIIGFTQYFLAQLVNYRFGEESLVFLNSFYIGLYFWFLMDLIGPVHFFSNEEDRQKRKVAE